MIPINVKIYENIQEKRNINFDELDGALNIVKDFLKERGLILYGGMAIDLSLKAAGHEGIYGEDVIPDYDFYTDNMYEYSNELAVILHRANMKNVSSINAMHITTRRVRVNYVAVADISHMPKKIFKILPTLSYKGFRIIHPIFQRLDMHRAFSVPYEHTPHELVYFRTKKDIKRYRLLDEAYPINIDRALINKVKSAEFTAISVPMKYYHNQCIGGILGYGILYTFLDSIGADLTDVFPVEVKLGDMITARIPKITNIKINIVSSDFIKFTNSIKNKNNIKYFRRFLDDIKPRSIEFMKDGILYDVHDVKGRLLPYVSLKNFLHLWNVFTPTSVETAADKYDVNIAMVHNILLYFLALYFREKNKLQKDIWLYLYTSLVKMVKIAEDYYTTTDNKLEFILLPFFLTSDVYGKYNWDYSYIITSQKTYAYIHNEDDYKVLSALRPPAGFYPDKNLEWPEYKLDSWIFTMDGAEQNTHHETLYPVIHL